MKYPFLKLFSFFSCLLLLAGSASCTRGDLKTALPSAQAEPISISSSSTPTLAPAPATPLQEKPTTTPTATIVPFLQVCNPFKSVTFDQLSEMIVNPYAPPALGSDEPHQGLDLAVVAAGNRALPGELVMAVLTGDVAAVINDRFPYGNAVMVETRLLGNSRLPFPPEILALQPTPAARAPLTCPTTASPIEWNSDDLSLYLFYAHLQQPSDLQLGDRVACGQEIGKLGNSGNALNPHLHLELRLGPAGARFSSMAHYDSSASAREMAAYCQWRTSGLFQPRDPFILFTAP